MTTEDQKHQSKKLWGGRFSGQTDPVFEKFNASISFDKRLWAADIRGSCAYARALARSHVITQHECDELLRGLQLVHTEWEQGTFIIHDATDEDIHTANERRLTELIGAAIAGKLHTGRSRNDQVATDLRLWLSDEITQLRTSLHILIESVIHRATSDIDIIMPGYTHLQLAQPIRWSHWLLSYASAWYRDAQRLDDLAKRVRVLPLGSGALAGNPFGIDRHAIAKELGFEAISSNSVDAVSDRDFVAEFLFWASLTMVHISQFAEDLIIFASKKMVQIADAYSTGSSLMPQKKNPDALELLRGKSGRVFGSLSSLIVLLKSLPKAYNKDLQEDKEPLFDAWMTIKGCLAIVAGAVATTRPVKEAMLAALSPDMLATDLAEYLVRKGVPFRDTHHIAGAAVKMAEDRKVPLSSLTLEDLKTLHSAFDTDVSRVWDYENSVNSRDSDGGTSRRAVTLQIEQLTTWLKAQGHVFSEIQ